MYSLQDAEGPQLSGGPLAYHKGGAEFYHSDHLKTNTMLSTITQ